MAVVAPVPEKKVEAGAKASLFDDDDEEEYVAKAEAPVVPVKKSLYDDDDDDEEYVPKPSIDEVVKNAAPVEEDDEPIVPEVKNPSPKHKRDNMFDANNDESDEYVPTEEPDPPV